MIIYLWPLRHMTTSSLVLSWLWWSNSKGRNTVNAEYNKIDKWMREECVFPSPSGWRNSGIYRAGHSNGHSSQFWMGMCGAVDKAIDSWSKGCGFKPRCDLVFLSKTLYHNYSTLPRWIKWVPAFFNAGKVTDSLWRRRGDPSTARLQLVWVWPSR